MVIEKSSRSGAVWVAMVALGILVVLIAFGDTIGPTWLNTLFIAGFVVVLAGSCAHAIIPSVYRFECAEKFEVLVDGEVLFSSPLSRVIALAYDNQAAPAVLAALTDDGSVLSVPDVLHVDILAVIDHVSRIREAGSVALLDLSLPEERRRLDLLLGRYGVRIHTGMEAFLSIFGR